MKPFADLLEALVLTPSRNAKLALLTEYFRRAPDPDRGWALACVAGSLDLRNATASGLRTVVEERVDPALFRLSYDYVGDLAETIALIWPPLAPHHGPKPNRGAAPEGRDENHANTLRLSDVVETLQGATREQARKHIEAWLDRLGASERLALIKLATGGLRVGVSERLAKTALAAMRDDPDDALSHIEEMWHGLEPPYVSLFAWLDGAAPMPQVDLRLAFRPVMLAHPLDSGLYSADERKAGLHEQSDSPEWTLERLNARLDSAAYSAEWKWDGIRVQAISLDGERRLYTRMGEEIGNSFPDAIANMSFEGVVDGELLVARDGLGGPDIAPFADLQKRLGRKSPGPKILRENPAHLRLYDLLHDGADDIRPLSFARRRARLDHWFARQPLLGGVDLSPIVPFDSWEALAAIRATSRDAGEEGLMLKRRDSAYVGGRPTGPWWKWKRDPLSADCVVMYAQRGHGKRSSYYSDFTFGCWREGPEGTELTPVGKAYSGFTDAELAKLDKWVRDNTTERFGPVRAVKRGLVFEVSFDAVQRSTRHKSGIAMRFPRIKRVRWDKPIHEADRVSALENMIVGQ